MIICKNKNQELKIKDLEENLPNNITDGSHTANIAYVENKSIVFVPCFDNYSFLKEMILWLNSEKFSTMIWLNETDNIHKNRYDMPFFVNERLCCAYEGELKIPAEKFHEYLQETSNAQKNLDNLLNPCILWMLEKILSYKDSMAFLNNLGEFIYINSYSRYINQDITYLNYDTPYKNIKQIGFHKHYCADGQYYAI